mgnify:FL=1
MPRKSIRDFSGGLVTYQSELDLADNQFQSFENVVNTKRGSVSKVGTVAQASGAISGGVTSNTEFTSYRTEKDGSNNDTSTQWWLAANALDVYRSDVSGGTSSTWASVNTYVVGSECITHGNFSSSSNWAFGTGWSFQSGEGIPPNNTGGYTTGSGAGALTQTSSNMTIALEKNKLYKLQFTLTAVGGDGKAQLTIKNQALTETYALIGTYNAATHTVYFSPQSSAGGIGFYAATDAGGSTNSFSIDDITVKEAPKHDLLIHNQILRISDGSFNSSNDSKWYGHIKRNFFGGGITYGTSSDGYKFRQPSMAVAKNAWVAEKTELTAPIVVPMKYAFDQNNDVDAANEVGIFVHFPAGSGNDLELIPSVAANTFNNKDRYTVTFIYDYVQESELGRDANGDVGVYAQNAVSGGGEHCPGIQLVPFTNTSGNFTGGTGWNQRITGINLYWQPEDDVDWYLVTTYDCNEGFSEDPRAKDSAIDTVLRTGTTEKSNNGYWIPCMEPYGASGDYYENINASTINTFTESDGGGSWGTAFAADNMVFVYPDNSITSLADVAGKLKETSTIICNIKSVSSSTLTTGTVSTAVSWKNWSGEGHSETPFTMSSARAFAATVSTDKVATWYIPNDGLKLATYNSLTGRAAETRLKPIKWNTSAVVGNKAFYANIDFKDENDQTLREKNRIVFTDNFKLDEAVVGTKFVDVGKNDGDEITALHSAQGRLYVFKTRNIYIYRIQSAQSVNFILERHIAGVGCLHKHAITETPYGLCFMDRKQISLLRGTEISELSLLIRDTYQTLGESMHQGDGSIMIGYDPILNMLVFSYALNAQIMYGYNFDTQSWVKLDMSSIPGSQSNMIINNDQRLQTYDTNSKRVENLFTGSVGAANLLLKTKRYDFGSPETFKRFTKLHITFKAGTTPYFKIYIDGSDTSEGQRGLDTFTTLNTHSAVLNHLGKTIEVEVYGISTDFRIDGIDIDYDIEGSNP